MNTNQEYHTLEKPYYMHNTKVQVLELPVLVIKKLKTIKTQLYCLNLECGKGINPIISTCHKHMTFWQLQAIIKIEGAEYWIKVKKINPTLTTLSIQEIENMYSIKAVNNFPASNGWQHWKFYCSNKKHTWCHRELTNVITIEGRSLEKKKQSPLKSANKGYPWNLFSTMSH